MGVSGGSRTFRPAVLAALVAVMTSACGFFQVGANPGPPQPCQAVYSHDRCEAILTAAAEALVVPDDAVSAIEIADVPPDPSGRQSLAAPGFIAVAHVGNASHQVRMCRGVGNGPACEETPRAGIGTPPTVNHSDIPCGDGDPAHCATPVPSADPRAVAQAVELRIQDRAIVVPKVGRYDVKLGEAVLANGLLTVSAASLADPWPDHVRLSSIGAHIEVRSLVPGRPSFSDPYARGWWPGMEPVAVFLVFEARHVDPGATLEIANVAIG